MSDAINQDETNGFVITSSDLPVVETEVKTEVEEQASSKPEVKEEAPLKEDDSKAEVIDEKSNSDESGNDTAAEDQKAKKPNGVQKRIDKVVREREEEKRKRIELESQIEELKGKKEIVESDFDNYDDYLAALDGDSSKEVKTEVKPEDNTNTLSESQKVAQTVLQEQLAAMDLPKDFESIALDSEVSITGDMVEALAECDDPVKVMMHLGNNKDIAKEIAGKTPVQQMREIAKLDMNVKPAPVKPVKTTEASDPISPVGGSDVLQKSIEEMSFTEYEAHMAKKDKKALSW